MVEVNKGFNICLSVRGLLAADPEHQQLRKNLIIKSLCLFCKNYSPTCMNLLFYLLFVGRISLGFHCVQQSQSVVARLGGEMAVRIVPYAVLCGLKKFVGKPEAHTYGCYGYHTEQISLASNHQLPVIFVSFQLLHSS